MDALAALVAKTYTPGGLWGRIQAVLEQEGLHSSPLTIQDLAPLDHFHNGGLNATRELAALADLQEGSRVLDVGSGLGGVARYLAKEHRCSVTGLDLTEEFCQVATRLSELVQLDHLTDFQQGNATELPFEEGRFHQVWTLQVQMSIKDKRKFYAEIFRVLQPGGKFVFQDLLAGPAGEIHFPVPWANSPEINFLISQHDLSAMLEEIGFQIEMFQDFTQTVLKMPKKAPADAAGRPPPLNLRLVMGDQTATRLGNLTLSLEEGRLTCARGVLSKPS